MPVVTKDTPVGAEFAGKKRIISWPRLWAFSGGPFALEGWPRKNLHTDLETAKRLGLYTVAASGTQYQGYVVSLLVDLFGEEWLSHGTMTAKFIAVVDVNDTLQPKVKVTAKEPQGDCTKIYLDIWCENQKGAKVLVGAATGLVRNVN